MVLKMLALRFGPISATHEARVRSLDMDSLDALAERLLTASTIDEAIEG